MSSLPRQLTHLQEKAWISFIMNQLERIIYFLFWQFTCPSSVRIGICTSPLVVAVVDTGVVALRAPSLKSTGPQEATEVYSPTWKITVGGLFKKGRASIFSPKCSHPPILPWLCRPSHLPRLSLLRRDLFRKLKAESGTQGLILAFRVGRWLVLVVWFRSYYWCHTGFQPGDLWNFLGHLLLTMYYYY